VTWPAPESVREQQKGEKQTDGIGKKSQTPPESKKVDNPLYGKKMNETMSSYPTKGIFVCASSVFVFILCFFFLFRFVGKKISTEKNLNREKLKIICTAKK
jgi:hypothetical protein